MSGFLCSMVGATFSVAAVAQVLRSKKTITAFGNAQVDTAQSKFGGASALFDGTTDYLDTNTTNEFAFGTGQYTIEGWIRLNSTGKQHSFFDIRSAGSNDFILYVNSSNKLEIYNGSTGTGTTNLTTGVWYHIAIVRDSTNVKVYLNGTQETSVSASNMTGDRRLRIGGGRDGAGYPNTDLNGWMDEIRVSNTARYTAGFTAPTAPFVNDANTVLLIHANGTDGSTFFEDDNGVGRSQTGISAIGNAQVDTAQSKFGGASFLGDGTGDYLQLDTYSHLSLTGDFTIECWFRIPGSVPGILPFYNSDHLFYLTTGASSGGRFAVFASGDNRYLGGDVAVSANTWHHIAFIRTASTITAYFNGVITGNNSTWGATISNTTPTIGSYSSSFLNGWIDEYRISNTVRYSSNFTPSTTPFVNDANTLLLIHANGTDASTVFTDDNAQLTITPAATSVNEGSSLTFNVSTVNTADQTLYWTVTNSGDFSTNTGSFSLANNAGSFSVTPTADTTTEGAETFTASVRTGSTSGPIIATSSSVTINDTSLTPLARPYASVASGAASVNTTTKYFGTGSLGYTGGHLVTTLNLPTGNFTIEYFVRVGDRSDTSGHWEITAGSHSILVQSGEIAGQVRNILFYITNSSGTVLLNYASAGGTLPDETWRHLAFVRNGNDFYVYMNGTRQTTSTQATFTMPNTSTMLIGRGGGKFMRGNIDEFRISNTARYTGATLTVPTAQFTNDANTVLLLHMNGTSGSTSFPDDNA